MFRLRKQKIFKKDGRIHVSRSIVSLYDSGTLVVWRVRIKFCDPLSNVWVCYLFYLQDSLRRRLWPIWGLLRFLHVQFFRFPLVRLHVFQYDVFRVTQVEW